MSAFFKKNPVLVTVLGLTLVIALVLCFLDLQAYSNIKAAMKSIENDGQSVEEIKQQGKSFSDSDQMIVSPDQQWSDADEAKFQAQEQIRHDPKVVPANAERIVADAKALDNKTHQLQRVFGHIYDGAMIDFLNDLKNPAQEAKAESAKDTKPAEAGKDVKVEAKDAKPAEEPKADVGTPDLKDAVTQELNRNFEFGATDDGEHARNMQKLETVMNVFKDVFDQNPDLAGRFIRVTNSAEDYRKLFEKFRDAVCVAPELAPDGVDAQAFSEAYVQQANARFDAAFAKFKNTVQQTTVEVLDDSVYALFLQALGLPRVMSPSDFRIYNEKFQNRLVTQKVFPQLPSGKTIDNVLVRKGDSLAVDNIKHIIRQYQIYEDVFGRMKAAGIVDLESLDCPEFQGKEDPSGMFRIYSYSIAVRGTMKQIRVFVNSLHNAYQQNRLYRMYDFSVKQYQVVGKETQKDADANKEVQNVKVQTAAMLELRKKIKSGDPTALKGAYDETEDRFYGVPLVGNNDQVVARFKFEYVIYEGDEVTKGGEK